MMTRPSIRRWQFLLISSILLCGGLFLIPPSASASSDGQAGVELHLLRPGAPAVGDLDGDQVPDVASGTNLGHTAQGYAYRVDLDLTANLGAKPFSVFSSEPNGLDIRAIDIDGDHDLDLVITSRLLQQPIGIWINDGRGNFTRGDPSQYESAFCLHSTSINPSAFQSFFVLFREPRQPQVVLNRYRMGFSSVQRRAVNAAPVVLYDLRFASESVRFRAPPAISSLS